jgi:deoxyribonuclease V
MAVVSQKLHPWRLSYAGAVSVQEELRGRVKVRPLALGGLRHVAGSDLAVSKRLGRLVAAVVVMTFPGLKVVETRVRAGKLVFPYIPGLLSFREIPTLIRCIEAVRTPFDVMLCDAQGIAHPRGLGLASHLGILIDRPTVGCAKSRLVGEHDDPGPRRGDFARLTYGGRNVGSVLRTREGVKPIFVSPGHLVDHPSSRRVAMACLTRYRLPEPTRLAHIAAGEQRRSLESATEDE